MSETMLQNPTALGRLNSVSLGPGDPGLITSAAWDVLQLQAARSKPILHMHRMAAENPVWIVCAQRGEGSAMPAASAVQTAQREAA